MKVREVMVGEVLVAHPEQTTAEVAGVLIEHQIHRLPVTDAEGRLVGVITSLDIARLVAEGGGA